MATKKPTTQRKVTAKKPASTTTKNVLPVIGTIGLLGTLGWLLFGDGKDEDTVNNSVAVLDPNTNGNTNTGTNTTKVVVQGGSSTTTVTPPKVGVYYYVTKRVNLYKSVVDYLISWMPQHLLVSLPVGTYAGEWAGEKRGDWVKLKTKIGTSVYTFWASDHGMESKAVYDSTKNKSGAILRDIVTEYNRK